MPGLKLHFLKNAPQRVASNRPLPLKQVEAILLYGRPEQRAKVVEKLLPNAYGLALNVKTHYILMTLLQQCENIDRVKLLYNLRRKILDICVSPVGNNVIQKLVELLPKRQRIEIAEAFVLNVEEDELKKLCIHPFGNHVAQKMMEFSECVELLEPALRRDLPTLVVHEYGMRVIDKYIRCSENGWKTVLEVVFGMDMDDINSENEELSEKSSRALDVAVSRIFTQTTDSMVTCALLRHPFVPTAVKDAICAHLAVYVPDYLTPSSSAAGSSSSKKEDEFALPDFGTAVPSKKSKKGKSNATKGGDDEGKDVAEPLAPKHIHTFCCMLEQGMDCQRQLLWEAIAENSEVVEKLLTDKRLVSIAVAAVQHYEGSRAAIFAALTEKGKKPLSECALDPVRTLVLRAFVSMDASRFTDKKILAPLFAGNVTELAKSPVASPFLQRLIESDPSGNIASKIFAVVKGDLKELVWHVSGSFLVQSLLLGANATNGDRKKTVEAVTAALGDLKEALAYAQGSRVLQKALAFMEDDAVKALVDQLVDRAENERDNEAEAKDEEDDDDEEDDEEGDEEDKDEDQEEENDEEEEKEEEGETKNLTRKEQREINRQKHYSITSDALLSYATHAHACYVLQALLLETRSRQLIRERRLLMNELKPHVFDLAVSPWAGRVVLDAMLQAGSTELQNAIKNVVFLKAESWLMEGPGGNKNQRGGSTGGKMDNTTRQILKRQREEINGSPSSSSAQADSHSAAAAQPPKKKKKIYRSLKM